ncbi:TenA family transcriptional regulator [Glaciecola sp. SC05]|uniref:TenA family transcriptional regulator n=1 Tax=Glaciecola sp. SC05 TaxID=1987355 RepID=UPI0035294135
MTLFERLHAETTDAKNYLLTAPLIERCFAKQVNKEDYVAFLAQAFHHVKHTVPLLMAVGTRLTDDQEWLREAVAEYIEEEIGHQEWILNDIAACGYDKEAVRSSEPAFATELMVAYAYDAINRKNPLSFFGMVHVLEGTSIALADHAADSILSATGVPKSAFSYLRSHGAIDIEHVKFFEQLMNKITDPVQQQVIIDSANKFYRLYADIFRSIPDHLALAKVA